MTSLRAPLAALLLLLPLSTACNGCDDGSVVCDADGHCQVCNSFGCHDAEGGSASVSSGGAHAGGSGGAGVGGNTVTTGSQSTTSAGGQGGAPPVKCDPATETCQCSSKADCSDGLDCINGNCVNGCDHDFECGAGKLCANGACVDGCQDGSCAAGFQCVAGACVLDPTHPQCTDSAQCDDGGICTDGVCAPGCKTNADCPSGKLCNSTTHGCFDDPSPTPACSQSCPGEGQVCEADGYCHYPCKSLTDCKLVDNRFDVCDDGYCKTQEEYMPECDLATPCPNGKDCVSNKCVTAN